MNQAPNPVINHGDPDRYPTHCRCSCATCDQRRADWPAAIELLLHPPPTEAELAEQKHQAELAELRRQTEQHRADAQAYWESEEGRAERKRRGDANYAYCKRLWDIEQNRFDVMCIYRPCTNRSSIDGEHDFDIRGTVAEQVAAVEKLVQMRAVEFSLFVHDRFLCELDWSLSPPARRITRSAALKELLTRIIRLCLTEDDDGVVKPALWRFTETGDMEPAEPDDLYPETMTQLIAAGRWYAPSIPARQLPPGEVYAELLPGLVDQLRAVALEAPGNRWRGSKAQLAGLTGQSSVQALTTELARLAAELASCGIEVGRTGSRTGKSRAEEWFVVAKSDPLSLSASQTDPDQEE